MQKKSEEKRKNETIDSKSEQPVTRGTGLNLTKPVRGLPE
ncbi:hypothetical protein SAMN04488529_101930 [Clostridium gasigenes]|uniref:Uncharacterized protein n=1 Tax=Clostridium gasigenes TaxID=94869 RepID=A0A1H0NRW9_9CLOT|nr:hypothetical protein SAMN04488529_101930 [Clostridium gasigenes]